MQQRVHTCKPFPASFQRLLSAARSPLKSWGRFAAFLSIVGLLITTCTLWGVECRPLRHFMVVEPGVLYRCAWLPARQLAKVIGQRHIRTVVNLCQPEEEPSKGARAREIAVCRGLGVKIVSLPLAGNAPPSAAQIERWLAIFRDERAYPVLVHCMHGVIRTNAMVAVYRIACRKEDNAAVLDELPTFGHDLHAPKLNRLNTFILRFDPPRTPMPPVVHK